MKECYEWANRVKVLEKTIFGNGSPGMQNDVREIRDNQIEAKGAIKLGAWILGFVGISQIVNIFIGLYK